MIWIIVIVILIILALVFFSPAQKEKRKQGQLRQQIRRKMRVSEDRAEEYIRDMKGRLEKKYPGRSEQWYLEKILSDLERGR